MGLLLAALLLLAAGAGGAWWWLQQPLSLRADSVEVTVPAGASLRTAARQAVAAGVQAPPEALAWYFRLAGRDQTIKPGEYEVQRGMTAADLLGKLVRGERVVRVVTLLEGQTFAQFRRALAAAPHLRQDSAGMSEADLMQALGKPGVPAEGRFFPDTYHYFKNASDMDILRQSMRLMDSRLAAAWQARAPNLPLQSPDEALILASIVEKETGHAADRALVAGVFVNRLRVGMRLQTDPTVIYGLGSGFDGNLRRRDLEADTPYNTYTRAGLPPTPIAMPGKAALMAAVQPASTKALYFVAKGDGSSHFSETLGEHNRAVDHYIRRRGAPPAAATP